MSLSPAGVTLVKKLTDGIVVTGGKFKVSVTTIISGNHGKDVTTGIKMTLVVVSPRADLRNINS